MGRRPPFCLLPGSSLCLALWILFADRRPRPFTWLLSCLALYMPVSHLLDPACVLTMSSNKSLHMDPHASRLVGAVTMFVMFDIILLLPIFAINVLLLLLFCYSIFVVFLLLIFFVVVIIFYIYIFDMIYYFDIIIIILYYDWCCYFCLILFYMLIKFLPSLRTSFPPDTLFFNPLTRNVHHNIHTVL